MCFPFLYLLFVLVPRTKAEYEASMVQLYGKVATENPIPPRAIQLDQTACTTKCLDDVECVLAYMDSTGYCLIYKYSELNYTLVVETITTTEYVVAFKTNTLTCPVGTYEGVEFAYVDRRNNVARPYQWTKTGTGWELTNPYPAPWQPWKRSDTLTICMQRFPIASMSQSQASDHCVGLNLKIMGIATAAERDSLTNGIEEEIWIDGTCPTAVNSACALDQYQWTDGFTTEIIDMTLTTRNLPSNAQCLYLYTEELWPHPCKATSATYVACGFQME